MSHTEVSAAAPARLQEGVSKPDYGDYVYVLLFKGSYKELNGLLGRDIFEDMAKLERLRSHIDHEVELLSEAGRRQHSTLLQSLFEMRRELEEVASPSQQKLHEIAVEMNFRGRSTRPSFGNGAHFILTAAAANEIEDVFGCAELGKGHVVFSPEYKNLVLHKLLANAKRPPQDQGQKHLHSISALRATIQKRHIKGTFCSDTSGESEGSLPTRLTHSTGSHPRDPQGKLCRRSYGRGTHKSFKLKCVRKQTSEPTSSKDAEQQDEELDNDDKSEQQDDNRNNDVDKSEQHDDKSEQQDDKSEQMEDIVDNMEQESCSGSRLTLTSVTFSILEDDPSATSASSPVHKRKLPVCKTSSAFADQMAAIVGDELMAMLDERIVVERQVERLASIGAQSWEKALQYALDQAKEHLRVESLTPLLTNISYTYDKTSSRSMKGLVRAAKESSKLVASRLAKQAHTSIDDAARKLKKRTQEEFDNGPHAVAELLVQELLVQQIKEVVTALDVKGLASECWASQERDRKAQVKNQLRRRASVMYDKVDEEDEVHEDASVHEDFAEWVTRKEELRCNEKFHLDRKGGRLKAITALSRSGNNRRRDWQVPI